MNPFGFLIQEIEKLKQDINKNIVCTPLAQASKQLMSITSSGYGLYVYGDSFVLVVVGGTNCLYGCRQTITLPAEVVFGPTTLTVSPAAGKTADGKWIDLNTSATVKFIASDGSSKQQSVAILSSISPIQTSYDMSSKPAKRIEIELKTLKPNQNDPNPAMHTNIIAVLFGTDVRC